LGQQFVVRYTGSGLVIDVESLLSPVSESSPCGEDLEYDADFLALEQACRGKEEQQFGDTVVPAEEPDWRVVKEMSIKLLARTKDIRIAVFLSRALSHTDGLNGYFAGLTYTTKLCETYWENVFPLLDAEYENDPVMRMNALATLASSDGGLRDLKQCAFLKGRFGQLLGKDFAQVSGAADGAAGRTEAELIGLISGAKEEDEAKVQLLVDVRDMAVKLQSLLNDKAGSQNAVDLKPLRNFLNGPAKLVLKLQPSAQEESVTIDGETAVQQTPSGRPISSGDIRSREDAMQALNRVCEFFERHEPTNPAPLFIRRAQRMMTMNFVDIIQELVPESMAQVQTLAGLHNQ
jgi:type VI secretion system protein ImpA